MFKQIILPILGVMLFIIVVGVFSQGINGHKFNLFNSKTQQAEESFKVVKIRDHEIKVEIAKSEKERQKGLSGRTSLPEDHGMLFVFETKNITASFWMKDMQIPLDLIWIKDGKIVKIDKNAPVEKDVADNKLKIYSAGTPIDYVLEVNEGYSDKNGIEVGNSVEVNL